MAQADNQTAPSEEKGGAEEVDAEDTTAETIEITPRISINSLVLFALWTQMTNLQTISHNKNSTNTIIQS